MKKLAILVSFLVSAAPVWAQSKNIHETVDPYTGLRSLFLEVSTRTCPGDASPEQNDPEVHLLFTAMQNPDNTVSYFVAPELDQASYSLHLQAHGTMDTLIDGMGGTFSTDAGSTTTNRYAGNHSYLHETIPFDASPDKLAQLSTAQWFQFRINGQHQAVQRCADAKRLRNLAEFLSAAAEYGPPLTLVSKPPIAHATAAPTHTAPALVTEPSVPMPFVEEISASTHLKKLLLGNIATQPCPGDPAQEADVRLSISANQRSDGGVWYFVSTQLSHTALLNLHRGEHIEVQTDGKTSVFNTINGSAMSFGPDATGQPVPHETIAFHVHQANLISLSRSAAVEFRIAGEGGSIHRCVAADQLKDLGEFISLAARYEPSHLATVAAPGPR